MDGIAADIDAAIARLSTPVYSSMEHALRSAVQTLQDREVVAAVATSAWEQEYTGASMTVDLAEVESLNWNDSWEV